jgi:hypothetical protein
MDTIVNATSVFRNRDVIYETDSPSSRRPLALDDCFKGRYLAAYEMSSLMFTVFVEVWQLDNAVPLSIAREALVCSRLVVPRL